MYLLDTCFLSELVKPVANAGVVAWLKDRDEETLFISVLTLGELQKGISKLNDSKREKQLQAWVNGELKTRFAQKILGIDEKVAEAWGRMTGELERAGKPMPTIDSLIAATAQVHHLSVVTRNVKDIQATKIAIVNPWR